MYRRTVAFTLVLFLASLATGQTGAETSPDPCAELRTQFSRADAKLKDWPALSRYRQANSSTPAPAKAERRVVFLGDSITDSWDDARFGSFFPGKPYVNRGISGQTTPQMLIRFRPDVIALKPAVVVILAGTNDLAGNTGPTTVAAIEDNLATMADLARVHDIRVVFASILPISDYERREGKPLVQSVRRPPEKIREINDWMRKFAAANRLVYLDYYSAMVDEKGFLKDELSNDGLHPNEKGYAVMAPLADAAIHIALKKQ